MAESLKMQDSMSRLERMIQEKLKRALLLTSITFVDRLELFIFTSMEKAISSVVESSLKELVTERRLRARVQRINLRRRCRKDATAYLKRPNGRYNTTFALLTRLTSPDTLEEQMVIRYFERSTKRPRSEGTKTLEVAKTQIVKAVQHALRTCYDTIPWSWKSVKPNGLDADPFIRRHLRHSS
jgi:hypothetical protein